MCRLTSADTLPDTLAELKSKKVGETVKDDRLQM